MNIDDLVVYKIACELESEVLKMITDIKNGWKIIQVNQINRSSSSVSANIAEGWSRHLYPRDFIRFLTIALGSSDETKHHLKVLYNSKCISEFNYSDLFKRYKNLSVRILNLIDSIKSNNKL